MEGSRGANSTSSHIKSGQIKIGSISINLANESHVPNVGECEHFSIRGYVSEMRKKDKKLCWPFTLENKESEEMCNLLPSLNVPIARWWCCQNCLQEMSTTENVRKVNASGFKSRCSVCYRSLLGEKSKDKSETTINLNEGNEDSAQVNEDREMFVPMAVAGPSQIRETNHMDQSVEVGERGLENASQNKSAELPDKSEGPSRKRTKKMRSLAQLNASQIEGSRRNMDSVEANTRGFQIPDLNMPYVGEDTSDPIVEMIGASENQYKLEDQPCIFNKNPADFSIPDGGNPYMIGVEDLKLQFPVAAAREAGLIKPDGRKRRKKSSAP